MLVIIIDQHVCIFLYALFQFFIFSSKSTNGKGQSQRLPIKGEDSRQNNAEAGMTGFHHKSSLIQGNTGDLTEGQQDPRKASVHQQRGNTVEKVCSDKQRTQK